MKLILHTAIAFAAVIGCAFGLTDDDLTPAALAGKTLTFTIQSGDSPLASSGVWTGKFETSPANGFTIRKESGTTMNSDATRTYVGYIGGHAYTIDPFIPGQPASTLTLWISEGKPTYYVDLGNTGSVVQYGDFTIGGDTPKAPEITVKLSKDNTLSDGKSTVNFGSVKIGKTGPTKTFTITNTGKADLTGIKLTTSGANRKDFVISSLGTTRLAQGKSARFTVSLKPSAAGNRKAVIKIRSNDADENPFDIKLTGKGAE